MEDEWDLCRAYLPHHQHHFNSRRKASLSKETVTEKAWAEQEHAKFKEPNTPFHMFVGDNGHRGRRAREGE